VKDDNGGGRATVLILAFEGEKQIFTVPVDPHAGGQVNT
jgi:hypothetical protein